MTEKIVVAITFLTGLGLIFIGARFLIAPEIAEAGYGIRFNEQQDYSFHYIKGIRDLFTGFLICLFLWIRQMKALGMALIIGSSIPMVDTLIVLSKDYNGIIPTVPHISAFVVCLLCGLFLLINREKLKINKMGITKINQ